AVLSGFRSPNSSLIRAFFSGVTVSCAGSGPIIRGACPVFSGVGGACACAEIANVKQNAMYISPIRNLFVMVNSPRQLWDVGRAILAILGCLRQIRQVIGAGL